MDTTDILIAGGGIGGLTAAARFAADGWRVTLVDPAPAQPSVGDLRTTAFLQPAIATLTRAGAWDAMQRTAAQLRIMRIVDAGGKDPVPRQTADFSGHEAGYDLFGWNVSNTAARAALMERIKTLSNVRLCLETRVTGIVPRLDSVLTRLADGTQIGAKLLVAADGRHSAIREMAGIASRRWEYGQKALVFAATHPRPHDGVSTEIHRTAGPLTLVPMQDHQGQPCSSVVWMTDANRADDLLALSKSALSAELTKATMDLYGPLEVIGERAAWPIISQVALRLTDRRLALVAEAAHVMPPIGAQGLNTSLHDIETLAGVIAGSEDPGAERGLAHYQMRILPRTLARVAGVDVLNRAAQATAQPLRDLRHAGLRAIHGIGPLRRIAVKTGLGV